MSFSDDMMNWFLDLEWYENFLEFPPTFWAIVSSLLALFLSFYVVRLVLKWFRGLK